MTRKKTKIGSFSDFSKVDNCLLQAAVTNEAGTSHVIMGQHHVTLEQVDSIVHAPPVYKVGNISS